MYLKRLEIQGFKTFANRTVFEFRPGITAVVGPNGSGKSNIADSVRWVLGEQSYAALRCKKTEELLYSGGGRRPPAGLAEVALTIDNSDRLLPIAYDEVTIARRATRDGENEYFINRSKVRLRDIQSITEPLGGSYTIINQGLVDSALTLRPEERRRLFEDAAEIGGYELRKAEAGRRLRETDSNMQRLSDLLSELEPRVRSLKRQAGQARQHRELSAELQDLLAHFYALQWRATHDAARAADAARARLDAALENARTLQSQAAAALRALRDEARMRREQLGALQRESGDLQRRAETAQRELAVGNERLAALSRRADDLERNQQDLALRQAEAERERSAAASDLAAAEETLAAQRAQLAAAQTEIAAFEQARRALAQEMSAAQDATVQAATALAEQRSRAEQIVAQRNRLHKAQSELDAAERQAAERLQSAQAQVAAAQRDLAAAETARAETAHTEQTARAALDALRHERGLADESLATARRTLADAEARLESLTRLARSYAGTFAGVKAAMQWAERAGRQGFALVASLIRTPAELETAIEVALGSRIQNIVVEQWHDAEEAIAELKRSGVGRATFLPLDTLRRSKDEGRPTKEAAASSSALRPSSVLGVAAELVDYDAHYAAVVQQLLGRVLVVRDLQTAREELRRLSGGWTIVTLGGEQINSGGAVTGGAQTKESGTLRRERELRELPQQVRVALAAVAEAEAHRVVMAERIVAATQLLREAEGQSREAARRHEAQRSTLDAATRRSKQAEQEQAWQQQRRENAARELAALAAQEAATVAAQAEAETHAATAQERLNELRARQEADSAAGREAQERFAGLRAAVAGAEAQVKAQRGLLESRRQALEQLTRRHAEFSRNADTLAAERAQISADLDRAEAAHQALLAEMTALRSRIEPAEAEMAAAERHLAELETSEAAATAALLEQEAAHSRATLEAQRANDRLESLRERAATEGIALADEPDATSDDASVPEASAASPDELQARIQQLKAKIERLGTVNPLALEEYEEAAERQQFLRGQLADLRQARATLEELIAELDTAMQSRFNETFHAVAVEFERSFTQLFGGGTGRLHLISPARGESAPDGNGIHDEEAIPVNRPAGVEIIARPPGKRQQNISLLSGGERTLTAAALLFAFLTVNPSPFCILDEVDAALDESNVGRFRDALTELTRTTQFILITHNRGSIEAADTLYGVTMGDDGASKVLSLRVEDVGVE